MKKRKPRVSAWETSVNAAIQQYLVKEERDVHRNKDFFTIFMAGKSRATILRAAKLDLAKIMKKRPAAARLKAIEKLLVATYDAGEFVGRCPGTKVEWKSSP